MEVDRIKVSYPPKNTSLELIAERMPIEYRQKFKEEFEKRCKDKNKKLIVYADGCFDMFHFGHMRVFEQIKTLRPNIHLLVGICSDEEIMKNKGSNVMKNDERIEAVRHCIHVDEILFPAPWTPTLEFMNKQKIDFIAHDTIPYLVPDTEDCYLPMKLEGRFLPTLRTEGVSTSDLLLRILKDKQQYYARNLKKGYSRKEMNLTYMEYLSVQMNEVLRNVSHCLKGEENNKKDSRRDSDEDSDED